MPSAPCSARRRHGRSGLALPLADAGDQRGRRLRPGAAARAGRRTPLAAGRARPRSRPPGRVHHGVGVGRPGPRPADSGHVGLAGLYLVLTLAAGLGAAALGQRLAHRPEPDGRARMTALLVALGAAVGAPLRYVLGTPSTGGSRPALLLVNVLGSGLFGVFAALSLGDAGWALLGTGFCGGFTSFSSFAVQSVERPARTATAYVLATTVLAVGACALGWALGTAPEVGSLAPAELVQAGVVEPEVVGHLVHDGDPHLLLEVLDACRPCRAAARGRAGSGRGACRRGWPAARSAPARRRGRAGRGRRRVPPARRARPRCRPAGPGRRAGRRARARPWRRTLLGPGRSAWTSLGSAETARGAEMPNRVSLVAHPVRGMRWRPRRDSNPRPPP